MNSYNLLCEEFDKSSLQEGYSDKTIAAIIKAGKGFGRIPMADTQIAKNAFVKTGKMKDAVKAVQDARLKRMSKPEWIENGFHDGREKAVMKFGEKRPNIELTSHENTGSLHNMNGWSKGTIKSAESRIDPLDIQTGKVPVTDDLRPVYKITTGDVAAGIRDRRLARIAKWRAKHDEAAKIAKADELFG